MKAEFPTDCNFIAVVGIQNGDEGKGRITQLFTHSAEIVCRPNAGSNAQHVVTHNNKEVRFRHVPVGAINPECINILGAGMVVNTIELTNELLMLNENSIATDKIFISDQVHLVFPVYRLLSRVYELHRSTNVYHEDLKIGSGSQGYGMAMEYKASKKGLRLIDFIDLSPDEQKHIVARLQLHILDTIKNYIEFYENQIPILYKPEEVANKRRSIHQINIKRTYAEELTRLLVMGLYGKEERANSYRDRIRALNNEVAKFSYESPWVEMAKEAQILVKEVFDIDSTEEMYFYDANLNFHIIQKSILLLRDKITSSSPAFLRRALKRGTKILFEGAQGTSLDVTHGLYPNSASGSATVTGMLADAGIGLPNVFSIGVCKPYMTTTGTASTSLITELTEEEKKIKESIRKTGGEKMRRICWLDIPLLKNNIELNGISTLGITHLDALSGLPYIKVCIQYRYLVNDRPALFTTNRKRIKDLKAHFLQFPSWNGDISDITDYEKLPNEAQNLIQAIANFTQVTVTYLTVGKEEYQTIKCCVTPELSEDYAQEEIGFND